MTGRERRVNEEESNNLFEIINKQRRRFSRGRNRESMTDGGRRIDSSTSNTVVLADRKRDTRQMCREEKVQEKYSALRMPSIKQSMKWLSFYDSKTAEDFGDNQHN